MVTKAETAAAAFEQKVFTFAESAISNPKVWNQTRELLETVEPELIAAVDEKVTEILLSMQKAQITVQLIKKENRPEGADFSALTDEFLLCVNRANEISKEIFETRTINLQGAGDGKKRQRKIELKVGNETLNFTVFRKILDAPKKKVETESEETE